MVNVGELVGYLFENCDEDDDFCGDMFYVEVEYGPESETLAIEIASRVCDEPSLIKMDPEWIVDAEGFDTYTPDDYDYI